MKTATKLRSFEESVVDKLQSPSFARHYINNALEVYEKEGDLAPLLLSLKRVAKSHEIKTLSEQMGIKRESLSRSLSENGNPSFKRVLDVMNAMGLRLTVEESKPKQ